MNMLQFFIKDIKRSVDFWYPQYEDLGTPVMYMCEFNMNILYNVLKEPCSVVHLFLSPEGGFQAFDLLGYWLICPSALFKQLLRLRLC